MWRAILGVCFTVSRSEDVGPSFLVVGVVHAQAHTQANHTRTGVGHIALLVFLPPLLRGQGACTRAKSRQKNARLCPDAREYETCALEFAPAAYSLQIQQISHG